MKKNSILEHIPEIKKSDDFKAIVDITGGKKIMSAAASLAAWQLDLPVCYVENQQYDRDLRSPVPGTEKLLYLPNPITIYGREELNRGIVLFNKGQYASAAERFSDLAERLEKPKTAKFYYNLSKFYLAWSDSNIIDFEKLENNLQKDLKDKDILDSVLTVGMKSKIEYQIKFISTYLSLFKLTDVKRLDIKCHINRLINFYCLGLFYMDKQRRFDFAVLFFYRTLEGVFQARLNFKYNLNIKKPDYSVLPIEENILKDRYIKLSRAVNRNRSETSLPDYPLGYANCVGLLLALKDEIFKKHNKDIFSQMITFGNLRNDSMLAHGYAALTENDSGKLRRQAYDFLKRFYEITDANIQREYGNLDEIILNLDFVTFKELK